MSRACMSVKAWIRAIAMLPLWAADAVLKVLVRPKRNQICYRSFPDYSDSAVQVFRHLVQTRERLDHVWLVRDTGIAQKIEREFTDLRARIGRQGHNLRVVQLRSLRGYQALLRAQVSFHTHGNYPFSRVYCGRKVLCLWHGMPIKAIGRALGPAAPFSLPAGTHHFATSTFYRHVIARCFGLPVERVSGCRLPRSDALGFTAGEDPAELKRRLGLSPEQPVVLWLPTFRSERKIDGSSGGGARTFVDDLPAGLMGALGELAHERGVQLLLKPHPSDISTFRDFGQQVGIRVLEPAQLATLGVQLYDLLGAVDGLISDVSSVVVDFLLRDKPIGLVGYRGDTFARPLLVPPGWISRLPGVFDLQQSAGLDAFVDAAMGRGEIQATPAARGMRALLHAEYPTSGSEAVARAAGL